MAQPISLTTLPIPNSHLDDEEKEEVLDPAPNPAFQPQEGCLESNGLQQVLENAAASHAGITTYPPNCFPPHGIRTTYHELLQKAKAKAQLVDSIHGLSSGSVVLLHFDEHSDNIEWFWAVTLAGYLPAISTPFVNDIDQRKKHLIHLNDLFSKPTILTRGKLIPDFMGLDQLKIHSIEDLVLTKHKIEPKRRRGKANNDLAALMLTSGSTGNAKAVCLSYGQILAAVRAKSKHNGTTRDDVFLNWIGLDHVVNLVESHIHAMDLGAEQIHVQAGDLLVEPLRFIRLIHEHRVTFTFAPNFFLAKLRRALVDSGTSFPGEAKIDLSCLRGILSGGEANVVGTCAALAEKLSLFGAPSNVIRPGYGLTETCAGITWGSSFPSYDQAKGLEFASVGHCLPDGHMRVIRDDGSAAVDPNEIGNLQLSGPMVFKEYYRNAAATAEAFTTDGWFIAGDKACIDSEGNLNLAGRAKEVIIINGIKYSPHEIETAVEDVPGLSPSYTVVFPHRPHGSETEEFCVMYLPSRVPQDIKARAETADAITRVCGNSIGARPYQVLPLSKSSLFKSSVGKLPRRKIQSDFESGTFRKLEDENQNAIRSYRTATRQGPLSKTEQSVLEIICQMLHIPVDETGTDMNIFELGMTSVSLFAFKQNLHEKLELQVEIPLIMLLADPSIRGVSDTIDRQHSQEYDPVVPLQTRGTKTPLWLVHPASGNVLAFIPLAKYTLDRPVYGLRARGVNPGELFFQSIAEIARKYHSHMKKTQPHGPYAIAGYSLGSSVAFEITKIFEAQGDEVSFIGAIDSPPHIAPLVSSLNWSACLIMVSYFLGLIPEEHASLIGPAMYDSPPDEVIDHILQIADPNQLSALKLDKAQLWAIADVTDAYGSAAKQYDACGNVAKIDVFYATPLRSVSSSRKEWLEKYLSYWKDFSREEVSFYECDGDHANILDYEYVFAFQKKLKAVLSKRGL